MSERVMLHQLPIQVDVESYANGMAIFLDALAMSIEELAAKDYRGWEDLVADDQIESEDVTVLALLHAKLKDIENLPAGQQAELLAYWHEVKNMHLDYLEAAQKQEQ